MRYEPLSEANVALSKSTIEMKVVPKDGMYQDKKLLLFRVTASLTEAELLSDLITCFFVLGEFTARRM